MVDIRMQLYKKNRLAGMCCETAAVEAGYSIKYARARAYRIERSAKIGMKEALAKAGLSDDYLSHIAKKRIEKSDGMTGLGYFQAVCKMKGHLVDKPLIELSTHEHFTVILKHPEPKQNGSQGNPEGLRANGETSTSSHILNLT